MNASKTLGFLLFLLAAGCSDCLDAKGDLDAPDAGQNVDGECSLGMGCQLPDGSNGTCEVLQCGEEPTCVLEEEFPCSAAPPFSVCGCGGTITSVSAGCPGPFGWRSELLTPLDAISSTYECNPGDQPPFLFDVTWNFEAVGTPADEGFFFPTIAERIPIDGSETQVSFSEELMPTTTLAVRIWIDTDRDGACSEADRVYRGFSSETEAQIDLKNYILELNAGTLSEVMNDKCGFLN